MGYIIIGIIGAIVLVAIMPFSIRNRTKFRQEQISKKLALFGIDLDFGTTKK